MPDRPYIVQGYRRQWDIPCEIHLGDFLPDPKPTVYYRDIGEFVLYCLTSVRLRGGLDRTRVVGFSFSS